LPLLAAPGHPAAAVLQNTVAPQPAGKQQGGWVDWQPNARGFKLVASSSWLQARGFKQMRGMAGGGAGPAPEAITTQDSKQPPSSSGGSSRRACLKWLRMTAWK
jgi:hypothetical protein